MKLLCQQNKRASVLSMSITSKCGIYWPKEGSCTYLLWELNKEMSLSKNLTLKKKRLLEMINS
ncbi:hypothetical protein YC2023_060197 [Brassica napus]